MTLAAYVNHFAVDTSGTSRSLSGFGHQPKLWLTFLSLHTSLAGWSAADFQVGMGATASSTREESHCLRMNDNNTGGLTRRGTQDDSCLISVNRNTNTEDGAYDTTSLDSDGVTLNISNTFASAMIAPYLSLGGSEVVEADVLQISAPTDAGAPYDRTYTFTGLTDAPTLLLLQASGRTSLGYGATGALFFGAADVNGQWAMMTKASENNPTVNGRIFRSDRCYAAHAVTSAVRIRASFVSFGTSGGNGTVTLNWDSVSATDQQIITLIALRGTFTHKVGVFTKATGSPWTNTVSLGGTPRAAFVATAAMTAMGTPNDASTHCRGGIGIYDGTRARAISWQDENNVSTSNVAGYTEDDGTILAIANNATATSDERLTPAFSGNDVVFTSQIQEAVAYEVGYVLLGDAGGGTTVSANTVSVSTTVSALSISTGSSVSAVNVASAATVGVPVISTGETIPAVLLAGTASIPAPVVSTGTTVVPTTVAGTASIGTPMISTGTSVAAVTIFGSTMVPAPPSILTGGDASVSANQINASTAIPVPSISAGSTVTAFNVSVVATTGVPTISTGENVNTPALVAAASIPQPSLTTSVVLSVATIAVASLIPAAVVTVTSGVQAVTVAVPVTVSAPTLQTNLVVMPATILAAAHIGIPDVGTGMSGNRRGCVVTASTNRRECAVTVIPASEDTEVTVTTVGVGAGV